MFRCIAGLVLAVPALPTVEQDKVDLKAIFVENSRSTTNVDVEVEQKLELNGMEIPTTSKTSLTVESRNGNATPTDGWKCGRRSRKSSPPSSTWPDCTTSHPAANP